MQSRRTGQQNERTVLSLFTGAGGLDLGLEAAGFRIRICVEADPDARATLRHNRPGWVLSEPGDIHRVGPHEVVRQAGLRHGGVKLLVGGPPCQPFSKSAYWHSGDTARLSDPRARTLAAYLEVVEAARPEVLLLENVQGLAFSGKDDGLELLRHRLAAINRRLGTHYEPQVLQLDAADYGVPQHRRRVFVVAQVDGQRMKPPPPRHGRPGPSSLEPYRTAWDAIGHLDRVALREDLVPRGKWAPLLPSIPEGQNYLWHTPRGGGMPLFGWRTRFWSFLLKLAKDQPSWTIQAQPGPATGPFHWRSRLLSIEELCRLQTFPKGYVILGNRSSALRQIGNAVPSAVGELLGLEVRRQLLGEAPRRACGLAPVPRRACPPPLEPGCVSRDFFNLSSKHADHPGHGLGPGARLRFAAAAKKPTS